MMLTLLAYHMSLMSMLLMRTVKLRSHLYSVCLVRIEALSSLNLESYGKYIVHQVKESLYQSSLKNLEGVWLGVPVILPSGMKRWWVSSSFELIIHSKTPGLPFMPPSI